ncbi:MAG: tyrosine--tRNA ligase [Pseudomonadota bacterium]|uniref:tyrosine--tRNA ligase n=1 Tax=Sphingobium sp. KCTC 72723 TaxID=2733867 RepID=UPI00165DF1BB|nr:tyrosine--tRNA ligase [Sphingobium sp. KCTC 72723]
MSNYQSDLLRLLEARGYIHQLTDAAGLDAMAAKQVVPGYIGFDPTAPSLHVGSLVQIMMLRRMQQAGHKPIVLMGGGTGKIGDPSLRDEARSLLTNEKIAENVASIKRVFERFLTFGDGPTDAVMVDNADWLDALEYIPFLRDIGQHFSVNRMLSFDSVKLRLDREQSLSFLEFNYMILQAYDFLELSRRAACRLQMGGSDQWGNIVNGIELARRVDGTQVFGLTSPLITTADGGKMGKTAKGAVWLNADALSPYDYWQFWRNTQDADVGRFMRLFTDLPLEEIAQLEKLDGSDINHAKKLLADAATTMAHGADAAAAAAETARRTFEEGASDSNLPTVSLGADGLTVVQATTALGFATSNKEVRRKLAEGAIRLNGEVVSDPATLLKVGDKLSFGAKKHGLATA